MAFNLCSSPASSSTNLLFCNPSSAARRPNSTSFIKLNIFPSQSLTRLHITHVTFSEETHSSITSAPEKDYAKTYIWVNPNSSRASELRKQSRHSRYTDLMKFAKSLNSCKPSEEDVVSILAGLGNEIVKQDAVDLFNNMSNPNVTLIVLRFFESKLKLNRLILYNLTLKVFKRCKDLISAEKLFDEMIERGVKPDNITFSTIISCARFCSVPNKAVEWFEKMPSFGCEPDGVTYSVMIDAYGRAGDIYTALRLYDRARTEKWRIDAVTFSTIIKIYGTSGNFDGCLNVYEEMKALGVKPSVGLYNTLLDAMGRAKRPWKATTIYNEMISKGFSPNWGTYVTLLRAYCRARFADDSVRIYKEMKLKGMQFNVGLYNTVLALCADLGLIDEAESVYEDMKSCGTSCMPDSWTFSSLITLYSCCGKISEAENAYSEMLKAGIEPNLFILTSLVQCYGKAGRTDDVVRTVDILSELDIKFDEQFCVSLLNAMAYATRDEQLDKLTQCVEKINPNLGYVLKLASTESSLVVFKSKAAEFLDSIESSRRRPYCNSLIDVCVNINEFEKCRQLLELGIERNMHIDMERRSHSHWCINLKSLSFGAALTAVNMWIDKLQRAVENGEELPPWLGINPGQVKPNKYSYSSDRTLSGVIQSRLKELDAPFHLEEAKGSDKAGWFLTTDIAAKTWLESRRRENIAYTRSITPGQ